MAPRPFLGLLLLLQALPCKAQQRPSEALGQAPGVVQWTVALVLISMLALGLLRVFRLLRKGESVPINRAAPEGMRPVECGACRTLQYASSTGRIFLCFSCRAANRVPVAHSPLAGPELVEETGPLRAFELKKGGEDFWTALKVERLEEGEPPPPGTAPSPAVLGARQCSGSDDVEAAAGNGNGGGLCEEDLPQCAVCLDEPGRMVLLPCGHGGVCGECATRIAQNRASGGAHCPHCRSDIRTLVELREVSGDLAKGLEFRIPMARHA